MMWTRSASLILYQGSYGPIFLLIFSENFNITRSDNGITLNDLYQDTLLNSALSCDYIVNTLTSLLQNAAELYVVVK